MNKLFTIVFALFFGATMYAQTVVTGTVTDASDSQPIPGVNIRVEGKYIGTSTDFDGNFTLEVTEPLPFKIVVTSIGYEGQTIEITENNQNLKIALVEGTQLDEVVVSASRTPESVRESPVTIERFGLREIKSASAASFYQSLENLKGVDVNTSSLTFNSVNTRGFATFANTRFVQLVDGMDNSSPALNFVLGNLIGVSELDLKSVELLPGASSALYGANAFNGILFMTTKNPFEDQGVSVSVKTGLTIQDAGGDNNFYDVGIRAAHAFSEKFAAKATFSYLQGTDWFATDTNQYTPNEVGQPDFITPADPSRLDHDGLNIYGDEITTAAAGTTLRGVGESLEALGLFPAGAAALLPAVNVGRTGYREQDLTDYEAQSIKADFSLNYRPFENDIEVIWNSRLGQGGSIYQGANRYQLRNFFIQQHKLEVKGKDFFLRGYKTAETAGDSYDMRFTGINMNRVNATEWFGTYAGGYLNTILAGGTDAQGHANGRIAADAAFRPNPGTPEFQELFEQVTNDPDVSTGSKFLDNTSSTVVEGNYNFSSLLNEAADIQVGGSYKQYSLDSQGTIFTDFDGPIEYSEYGAYVQASKKFADERLKLTASFRYDKNDFFDANISPRASIVYAAGENRNHNFRASFQTGFRNPDTQSLFIGFNVGRAILVGSSPDNLDRILPGTALTGRDVYFDSYSQRSVGAFAATGDPSQLEAVVTDLVQPEKVTAYDVGYRGRIGKFDIDLNGYYNSYEGFIANKIVVTPNSGSTSDLTGVQDIATGNFTAFQTYTNSLADVSSYGFIVGVNTKLYGFNIGANYTLSKFDFDQETDPDFQAGFNTPEHKVKVSLGHTNLFDSNIGFNVNARYSTEYFWQSTIANAFVPERTIFDAQVSYTVPKIKSVFKIGGSNIGGTEYQSAPGTGAVGSQFYVSWIINN